MELFWLLVILFALWWFSGKPSLTEIWGRLTEDRPVTMEDLRSLTPTQFEVLVGRMLQSQGYQVDHTGGRGDRGVDLVAIKGRGEFEKKFMVQAKHRQENSKRVGIEGIRSAYGAAHALLEYDGIIIVTNGQFTKGAQDFAMGKAIQLMSGSDINDWLNRMEIKYKDLRNLALGSFIARDDQETTALRSLTHSLGYDEKDARLAIKNAKARYGELPVDQLIRRALEFLSRQ
jgi:hypothetical protein